MLRRGETGVLKLAASPQHIESVLSHFLHRYGRRFPNVEVRVVEAAGRVSLGMLERGEIHLAQNLLHAIEPNSERFGNVPLQSVELLAACHPSQILGRGGTIEIDKPGGQPLLLLDTEFIVRRTFDAACRLAGLRPNIRFASRAPHTLLALAEAGHGVAIIPSQLRTNRYRLNIAEVTRGGKTLREPLAMLWDRRRPLPPYATAYCEMLGEYVREVFPITRPSAGVVSQKGERLDAGTHERGAARGRCNVRLASNATGRLPLGWTRSPGWSENRPDSNTQSGSTCIPATSFLLCMGSFSIFWLERVMTTFCGAAPRPNAKLLHPLTLR